MLLTNSYNEYIFIIRKSKEGVLKKGGDSKWQITKKKLKSANAEKSVLAKIAVVVMIVVSVSKIYV